MADSTFRIDDAFAPQSLDEWRARLEKDLKGKSYESLRSATEGGLPLEPLYTRADAIDPARVGVPGLPPYTRGADAARRGWRIRQEYDDPRPEVVKAQIADDLGRGVDSIFVRVGLDRGTRVLTAGDVEHALDAVDPGEVDVWLSAGEDGLPVAAAYLAFAARRGAAGEALRVSFGADPLGTLASRGALTSGLRGAYRDARALALHANGSGGAMRALRVDTAPYAEAGASATDELAFALATYVAYLAELTGGGLSVDEAAGQIDLAISTGGEFFEQIAKLRALRLLVAKVVGAAGGSAAAQVARVHARNGRFTKSARDPWVNLLRGTAESFAAALGGADSVATECFDAAHGSSDAFARRLARNTQLVLREEARVGEVLDPAGGSYFLERFTDQLARSAWDGFRAIERAGGMRAALLGGEVAARVEATHRARTQRLRSRARVVLGVNEYPNLGEAELERESVDVGAIELGRSFGAGDRDERYMALIDVNTAAQSAGGADLVGAAIRAIDKGADLGSLREVLVRGEATVACEPLRSRRAAELWERLRDRSDEYLAQHGTRPRVFLALLGSVAEHTARATWTQNLLSAGGFECVAPPGLERAADFASAMRDSGATIAVVAGPDARYDAALPALTEALKEAGASAVLLAGAPSGSPRDAEIDHFVHVGADVYGALEALHQSFGADR